jgi:hypothetical protein
MRLDEIVISKKMLARITFWILMPLLLIYLGHSITPFSNEGKMLFLSPHVAQIAAYQNAVKLWVSELKSTQAELQSILDEQGGDLFQQDSKIQDAVRGSQNLTTSIDGTTSPDTLSGLRSLILDAANANEQAAIAIAVWASAPSDESLKSARDSILSARTALGKVYNNPWVILQVP